MMWLNKCGKKFRDNLRCLWGYLLVLIFCVFIMTLPIHAQEKQLIQIKTFDQQLQPMKNVAVSINDGDFVNVGDKGVGFVEMASNNLPIKTIKVKNETLEPSSWNYSKGVLQIIVRNKNYQLIRLILKDGESKPIPYANVIFKGKRMITATTNAEGKFEIPLPLEEKINAPEQFIVNDYQITGLQMSDQQNVLTVNPIKQEIPKQEAVTPQNPITAKEYFKDFDLSKLDSIQSLTVFYAIFKNYPIQDLSERDRKKVDAKFNELIDKLQDSVSVENNFIGKISDSSYVNDDVKNLLSQASLESQMLEAQRKSFDEKISLISGKLAKGIINLDTGMRAELLTDLTDLEKLLAENEGRFYKNQNDYRQIINALKEKYFNFEHLESKLSESEAQRMEEQRVFKQRLFTISGIMIVFAILILLLVYVSTQLRNQKKKLVAANAEVKRMNENLEGIVTNRTRQLKETNLEIDVFLYRASHDLRSPVCSIMGLCNIAPYLSQQEFAEKVRNIAIAMDMLLAKLSMISEINQPTDYSSVRLLDFAENISNKLMARMQNQRVTFKIDCPRELVFYSYPNLIDVILSSLLENAIFFSLMKDPEHARVEFKASIKGDYVELSVYDNGIGINNSIRPKLYDMFFKGHERSKGNGLGLYMVKKSVQTLEGRIEMESEQGSFTKFIVLLPLHPSHAVTEEVEVYYDEK